MFNKFYHNYFLILFSFIPVSFLIGPSISLINILLIDISFILLVIYLKDASIIFNKQLKYFYLLLIYLVFNSLISLDIHSGLNRNLGFIRIIILFIAFNYFFYEKTFYKKVFFFWSIVIFVVALDVFIESYLGKNILGFEGKKYGGRIVSFFKDEPVIGSYLNAFFLILIGFLFNEYKTSHKNKIFFFSIILLMAIILTGERSNSIKAILAIILFYATMKEFNLKQKLVSFSLVCLIMATLIFSSGFLKYRFINQFKKIPTDNNIYLKLYKSGFEVFKNNPIFGVGNKNYRIETCGQKKLEYPEKRSNYICQTHPHQIYLEFLSEHGIIGTIILLFIFYKLIFSKLRIVLKDKNHIQIASFAYLILVFLPLLPSGAFFSDFVISLFTINISIFYSCSKKMNIFNRKIL
tara:strand:- start:69 stop:1292 length:1224 start_codon:yes stop_codon:yes gene_type:complete